MKDRLITIAEAAAILGLPKNLSKKILAAHNLSPVDFGAGRGRGLRWLESVVENLARKLFTDAQAKNSLRRRKGGPQNGFMSLTRLSNEEFLNLTSHSPLQ